MKNNNKFVEKGCLYLWHKDNCGSINSEDIETGAMVYISIYDGLAVDGYNGTVGKPEDFREKLYVEYEWEIGKTEIFEFKDENGEWDTCEACWARISNVLGDCNE